jgi:hypothetical protein
MLLATFGCGSSEFVPVNGTVTLDGTPLSGGTVAFKNVAEGPLGYGTIQADGKYAARTGSQTGLKPGKYQVTVVATEQLAPTGLSEPVPKLLTPTRYANVKTSDLRCTVSATGEVYDIVLETK